MSARVPITIQLTVDEYRLMTARADAAGVQVKHLIEASITRACRPTAEEALRARIARIRELHQIGLNDRQIAERLDLPQSTVYHHRHVRMRLLRNDPRGGSNRYTKGKAA